MEREANMLQNHSFTLIRFLSYTLIRFLFVRENSSTMNFHIWKGEPSWVQPPHVQEDGEEKAGQEGEVQDTARHLHGN